MMIVWILLALLLAFLAALIVRALRFTPPISPQPKPMPVAVDAQAAVSRMQAMLRLRTVSYDDGSLEDDNAFEAFPALLQSLYPAVEAACGQERIGRRGILYRWKGRSDTHPTVLMAHYDVVPADASDWRHPPFDGVLEDGILWGRGTLDTKGTLLGIMEAAEQLIQEGFVPAQDLYFCFGGNEEIGGDGAPGIVQALKARGVHPALVLDEGGAVVERVFPGVDKPAALIGIGEKGTVNMTFHAAGQGGHASAPPAQTLVGRLARAVTRVENTPFPFRLTAPALALFDTLGRHSSFLYRLIFANLWCFSPLLNLLCRKTGGEMNALVRTTCAFTQMSGSSAPNVMPLHASVGANLRIISGETMDSARDRLVRTINDPAIDVVIDRGVNPSPNARPDGEPWARLQGAIGQTWPEAIVSPYLMVAASDSQNYASICDRVYRFCPIHLTAEERGMIHSRDERIPVEKLVTLVEFYVRLIKAS